MHKAEISHELAGPRHVGASWWSWHVKHGARAGAGGGHWTQPVEKWGQWTLTMPGHYAVILPRFSGKTE